MSETRPPESPYKGLTPYTEDDAQFFFGREREREVIAANLMASRLTLLYGESGVGKSSVLRAGVAHYLRGLAQRNLTRRGKAKVAVVYFNSWRDDPLVSLAARVQASVAQVLNDEAGEPVGSSRSLAKTLQAGAERVDGNLLVILDQFEEYFLYHERGAASFNAEFPQVVNSPSLRANFLISIRDDVLAKLDHFKGPIPNLFDNSLRIEHLNEEAARAAIAAPIEKYTQLYRSEETRVGIEPALVEAVVNQVKTGQVILGQAGRGVAAEARTALSEVQVETPYLQLVMERLWNEEKRAGPFTLRLETLNLLGGADRIVRGHLEVSMSKLRQGDRAVAARIFYYLVTPSGTKIAHTVPDLAKYAKLSPAELLPVLSTLSSGQIRILRQVDPPPRCPDEPRYEIFHDALVPAILDWQAKHDSTEQRSPEWIETLPVGPSKDRAAWTAALRDKDDAILANLVERELPGVSLLEISSYINGLYHATRYAGTSVGLPEEVARRDVERVLPIVRVIRRRLGWRQCEVDIKVMRLIRRSGALSMVIGPGVTMNAGGPSWLEVVRLLLKIALEKGHEVTRQVPSPQNPPGDPIRFLEEGGGRTGWDRHVELLAGGRAR